MIFIYLHGFNGGSPSHSAAALSKLLDAGVFCPQYDYSRPFEYCYASLLETIAATRADKICLLGTSLGGFYALSLRHPSIKRVVAWNPVVFPALQLLQFVGLNVRFHDGVPWEFRREIAVSYAEAPDPRVWANRLNPAPGYPAPVRRVIIGDRDEILNSELCIAYWRQAASLSIIESGHSVENYDHLLKIERDLDPNRS